MNDKADPQETAEQAPESAAVAASIPDDSAGWALAELASWHLLEKSAREVVVLDLRGHSDVCDFFVLASGESEKQVTALARNVHSSLAAAGHKAKSLEGMTDGGWALLDFFDVVVHVFHTRRREYFQLEKLWSEGARLDLEPGWFADPAVAARHPGVIFAGAGGPGGPQQG
jgi:ribosome-associated protein